MWSYIKKIIKQHLNNTHILAICVLLPKHIFAVLQDKRPTYTSKVNWYISIKCLSHLCDDRSENEVKEASSILFIIIRKKTCMNKVNRSTYFTVDKNTLLKVIEGNINRKILCAQRVRIYNIVKMRACPNPIQVVV